MSRLEKDEINQKEIAITSYQESYAQAKELLEKHKDEINSQIGEDIEEIGKIIQTEFFNSIKYFLDQVPEEIKDQYYGHGVTRGYDIDQLAAALNITANEAIMGWQGKVSQKGGGYEAYTSGKFIIISHFGKQLAKLTNGKMELRNIKGSEIGEARITGSDREGTRKAWVADIGAIVANSEFYSIVDDMKKMYPEVNIIKANELAEFMKAKK